MVRCTPDTPSPARSAYKHGSTTTKPLLRTFSSSASYTTGSVRLSRIGSGSHPCGSSATSTQFKYSDKPRYDCRVRGIIESSNRQALANEPHPSSSYVAYQPAKRHDGSSSSNQYEDSRRRREIFNWTLSIPETINEESRSSSLAQPPSVETYTPAGVDSSDEDSEPDLQDNDLWNLRQANEDSGQCSLDDSSSDTGEKGDDLPRSQATLKPINIEIHVPSIKIHVPNQG